MFLSTLQSRRTSNRSLLGESAVGGGNKAHGGTALGHAVVVGINSNYHGRPGLWL